MENGSFLKGLTPLVSDGDSLRPERAYPGGDNLNRLFGVSRQREEGWYYPEAWLFSPIAAMHPGGCGVTKGLTLVYDSDGKPFPWDTYLEYHRDEVLGDKNLSLIVKLLDGAVTLPKEFHFREEDLQRLRSFPRMEGFRGTVIKPECWIRHPEPVYSADSSYVGFAENIGSEELAKLLHLPVHELESVMNSLVIAPWNGVYVPGGVVHSLGRGLYFEILADGDLKVTLQARFMGKELSSERRIGKLYTGDAAADLRKALEFIDYELTGEELLRRCMLVPKPLDEYRSQIVRTPYFSGDWIEVPVGRQYTCRPDDLPHVMIAASGRGTVIAEASRVDVAKGAMGVESYLNGGSCYGAVVHASTGECEIVNTGGEALVLLDAFPGCQVSQVGSAATRHEY